MKKYISIFVLALILLSPTVSLAAPTVASLQKENTALKAKIKALEAQVAMCKPTTTVAPKVDTACAEKIAFFENNDVKKAFKDTKAKLDKISKASPNLKVLAKYEKDLATSDADFELKTNYVNAKVAPDSICKNPNGTTMWGCDGIIAKYLDQTAQWLIEYKLKTRPALVEKIDKLKITTKKETEGIISSHNYNIKKAFDSSGLGQCKQYNYDYKS